MVPLPACPPFFILEQWTSFFILLFLDAISEMVEIIYNISFFFLYLYFFVLYQFSELCEWFFSLLFSPGLWASSYPPSFPPSKMELHPLSRDTGERGVDQEAALSQMWPPHPCEAWNLSHWAKEPVLKILNWNGGWEGYKPAIKHKTGP